MSKPTETELLPERIWVERMADGELALCPSIYAYGEYVRVNPSPPPSSAEARERAREIVNEYAERQPDSGACPHCGEVFANERLRDDKHVPTHDWPKPCRQVCPGTGQFPVPDPTPLIDAIASAISTPQPTLSDAVQAESDAYAQGYQDGSVSQPTLQQAIECVRDYRKWYDEKMFTPVTTEETQAVHKQFDGMVDRISAAMARHLIDKLIEQLESLASTQE